MTALSTSLREICKARRCTRAFRPDPVPRELLADLIATAALAPSTFNTQPWRIHVITGNALSALSARILDAHSQGIHPVFTPFPDPCPDDCAALQADFGRRYCEVLGISRDDAAARGRQTARNYAFFGAPVGLMLTIDRTLKASSWLDLGLFLQTLMLAACERGLGTCPQVAFLRYESVIAAQLGFRPNEALACGMSLGYPDADASVNHLAMPRAPQADFVRWH